MISLAFPIVATAAIWVWERDQFLKAFKNVTPGDYAFNLTTEKFLRSVSASCLTLLVWTIWLIAVAA